MARVKRAVNAQKKRRVVLERASGYRGQRSRLYRKAKEQVTHSLGLRLPRPSGPQGRLPSPVDPADQRRRPRERHDLQPVHPGPEGRRRSRSTVACSPSSPSTTPPRSPRSSRSPGPTRRPRPRRRDRRRLSQRLVHRAPGRLRADQPAIRPGAGGAGADPARRCVPATGRFLAEGPQAVREAVRHRARRWSATSTSPPRPPTRHADDHRRAAARGRAARARGHPRGARRDGRHRRPAGRCSRSAGRWTSRSTPCSTPRRACSCVLTHVRDPGNAGTVIRGADAAGADAVAGQRRQRRRLQPQGRALHRRVAVPPAGRDRRPDVPATAARRLRGARLPAAGRRRRRAPTCCTTPTSPVAARLGHGQRGVGPRPTRCATPATRWCGCRSTAAPSRSTSRWPRPSASTRPRGRAARRRTESVRAGLWRWTRHAVRRARVPSGRDGDGLRPAPRRPRGRRRATPIVRLRQPRRPSGSLGQTPPTTLLGTDIREVASRCRTTTGASWWTCTDPWGGLATRTGHRERLLVLPGRRRGPRHRALRPAGPQPAGRARSSSACATPRRAAAPRPSSAALLSTVAHELRSPLTSVKGFSSTLLRRLGPVHRRPEAADAARPSRPTPTGSPG